MKKLRIFAASPSDMATERSKVETVASTLKPIADNLGIVIEVCDWSRVIPDMGRAEQVILDQLKPTSWDVFIGILWHRFGTPPAAKDERTQEDYLSGTEEEFRIAYRLWQQYKRPRIMMYRCMRPIPPDVLKAAQFARVDEFFSQFDATEGKHPGLYQSFDQAESFERLLLGNLQELLIEYGKEAQGKTVSAEVLETFISRIPDNLPRRLPFFGREDSMEITMRALSPEDRTWGVLLDGIGGIGKTAFAIEAAHRSKEKGLFDAFIYVSAKRDMLHPSGVRQLTPAAQTLDEFMGETARVLGEPGVAGLPINEKRPALLNTLRKQRALLIYDNLETLSEDEQETLADFLRELPQGCKAIITSRRRGGEGAVWLRLEKLEWNTAKAIIESEIQRAPQLAKKMRHAGGGIWRELYEETKGSPLALVHTLGLLRIRATLTFNGALTQLRGGDDHELKKFIFEEARRELTSSEVLTLYALTFFDPSATFDALLQVTRLSRNVLELSIDRLNALSLVDVSSDNERYALHPLIRNFVRDELQTNTQLASELEKRVTRYWSDYSRQLDVQPLSITEPLGNELKTLLNYLAWNYWWSWSLDGHAVFRDLDQQVWDECEHNPRRLLKEVPQYNLMRMATDPVYVERVRRLAESFDAYMAAGGDTWAAEHARSITQDNPVAYFCAEFGVHHSLPLYSGGLGILAGDHLKSASDLGLPLIAVGLLYHHGYFRQRLRREGWQEETYSQIVVGDLPLQLMRERDGSPIKLELEMRGRSVYVQAWRVAVGRVPLYLLDTNVDDNEDIDRLITGHLYGGDRETRCVQEMVLGVGGVRLLRRLGIEPHVFHLNEGHSAFLTLELVREQTERDVPFEEAAAAVRARCTFTMHAPVAAGHDEFLAPLIESCFGSDYWCKLGLSREEFLNLGRVQANDESELFGLTPLALRMCRSSNGVSRKHGEVSRELWNKMWPERRIEDVPITHVTNGVHTPTWISPLLRSLFEKYMGRGWMQILQDPDAWVSAVASIANEELWKIKRLLKQRLVAFVRERVFNMRLQQHEPRAYADAALDMFDPDALTIGFARRVAAYKRWGLILTDPARLHRILLDADRPVQLVFAGKAHPQDQGAKLILQQVSQWKEDPAIMQRAVFLQDYDQEIARQMVQSVDVWLSAARPPLEASGTSGQKVAVNGGLNLSTLDGWWLEGYDGMNGWAIGDPSYDGALEEMDHRDAESLYRVLETEVVPAFYERDEQGIPRRWVEMIRHAIGTLAPPFNGDRMVRDYIKRIYVN